MKKLLFAVATMGLLFTSCSKDDDSNGGKEPKDAPLAEFVLGNWNFTDLSINGNIQSPLFSGPITGTSTNVSGNWEFKADGTVSGQMKYNLSISVGGFPFDEEEVDEPFSGTYTVKNESTLTVTIEGEAGDYKIENRTNTSFDAVSTEEINDSGVTGSVTTRVKLSK